MSGLCRPRAEATPADVSIGMDGRHHAQSPAEFIGMRMLELIDDLCDKILALHGDQLRWALRV
jgi:hypothetical protein